MFPDDPYSSMRETAKLFATAKGTPYLAFPPNRKFDDLTQFVEARLGMATHILQVRRASRTLSKPACLCGRECGSAGFVVSPELCPECCRRMRCYGPLSFRATHLDIV